MRAAQGSDARQVMVIGAGAAGLSAAGALTRRGIDVLVLERDADIGGSWARRYDRLRLHTVRRLSGLAHVPIPRRYPRYLSRADFVEYLQDVAARCGAPIVHRTHVARIEAPREGWLWTVRSNDGVERRAAVVVVATGQYRDPVVPDWPGRPAFSGRLTHSVEYTNGAACAGQRVLVVGAGNSGAEIATDLAASGVRLVALSVRTPPPIVPRDPFGVPVQRTSLLLSALPAAAADRIGRLTARLAIGDLTRYGMPQHRFNPYTTKRVPLIDVGFVDALKRGRIQIRPAVERLTASGAEFADGRRESFDAIIAATGFSTGLESLLDVPDVLDERGEPRGISGEPTTHPGLYFVGFTHSVRGHLLEANRASRRLARNVDRYLAVIADGTESHATR